MSTAATEESLDAQRAEIEALVRGVPVGREVLAVPFSRGHHKVHLDPIAIDRGTQH